MSPKAIECPAPIGAATQSEAARKQIDEAADVGIDDLAATNFRRQRNIQNSTGLILSWHAQVGTYISDALDA
jgi:hypothetical protein